MGQEKASGTGGVDVRGVMTWVRRMGYRTQFLGAVALAITLCGEASEYLEECVGRWEADDEWATRDDDTRARAVAGTLLENADAALEMMWEHLWDYEMTCDPSWLVD